MIVGDSVVDDEIERLGAGEGLRGGRTMKEDDKGRVWHELHQENPP